MDDPAVTEENDLVTLAGRGCEDSFRRLFERYYPLIHSYAWKLCGDSAAADDIAQQTFIKAASQLRSPRKINSFKSWIHRVALNTARDHQRATARYRQRLLELEVPPSPPGPNPGRYENLTAVLDLLSNSLKETVLLVFAQGLTHKEAAQVLDCPEGTVAWRISEARKCLKQSHLSSHERS